MKSMKEIELGNEGYEDGLNRYVKIEGIESMLVNIPTIVTGVNDDGTINQKEVQPYAYEIVEQNKRFTN